MEKYTGTKDILAKPMTLSDYNNYREWAMPEDEDPLAPGYLVEYLDGGKPNHPDHKGYISWSPADVFERSYRASDTAYDRVLIEIADLSEKLSKLNKFLTSDKKLNLQRVDEGLLINQKFAMKQYLNILKTREVRMANKD